MKELLLHPLLQGDDLLGAILFFVIWAAIAIFSTLAKWKERKRHRERDGMFPPLPEEEEEEEVEIFTIPPRQRHEEHERLREQQRQVELQRQLELERKKEALKERLRRQMEQQQELQRRREIRFPVPVPPPAPPAPPQASKAPLESSRIQLPEQPPVLGGKLSEEIGSATEGKSRSESKQTRDIRRMLNPRSLRQHFVMLELIQPPLALRDNQP